MRRYEVWHPESPGVRQIVWRRWWQRRRAFASLSESICATQPPVSLIENHRERGEVQ